MSEPSFTFDYSAHARHVRGVYLPATLALGVQQAHVVLRVDSAATYCVLERPWAAYFGLTWDDGDSVSIGTAVGGFQAYLHVLTLQIDRFRWETPVAIAEFESPPGAVPRQVLGLGDRETCTAGRTSLAFTQDRRRQGASAHTASPKPPA
ncbi:MAG: hypothetical protein FJZ47_25255 [Candidatus Tectomicrobia bacterium]|uniref:Uncharacterized protein n=1 Tax=Tectimicrobiota bacterium TaxID=2528274 RepID=A0A937W4X3_UNCTE|nr:hypothetical protein [Candidatus Tectomicrobia bacterium]